MEKTMQIITPAFGKDYELVDTGDYRKLERFGQWYLSRPEPQAVWPSAFKDSEWKKMTNAVFSKGGSLLSGSEKGEWITNGNMPGQWVIEYKKENLNLRMRLGLSSFKHVGVFPEQCDNWDYIYNKVSYHKHSQVSVLNLFAYTGGASLAAASAGADVIHVDSVKQVLHWSKQNMELSGLKDIRWVLEDALSFASREARRGKKYQGIILDPPAYGRGPAGEKWQLETHLSKLLEHCRALLDYQEGSFMVLNLYSMGFSALIARNLLSKYFDVSHPEYGELAFADRSGHLLPLGIFARFSL